MINELIGRVFTARDLAHKAHWATQSYAEHIALGSLYEALPGLIDAIVEAHQGMDKLVDPEIYPAEPADLTQWLRDEAEWIEVNREACCLGSNAIGALIDNLCAAYLSAVYKLKNLK